MDRLLDELKPEQKAALLVVREWASEHLQTRPKLGYSGLAWRWTEQYANETQVNTPLDVVYLIPDPNQARVGVCCDRRYFDVHPPSLISKPLLSVLTDAVCIKDRAWCTWDVSNTDTARAINELLMKMISE